MEKEGYHSPHVVVTGSGSERRVVTLRPQSELWSGMSKGNKEIKKYHTLLPLVPRPVTDVPVPESWEHKSQISL